MLLASLPTPVLFGSSKFLERVSPWTAEGLMCSGLGPAHMSASPCRSSTWQPAMLWKAAYLTHCLRVRRHCSWWLAGMQPQGSAGQPMPAAARHNCSFIEFVL